MKARVKAAMEAHRKRLDFIDNHFRDDTRFAQEYAMEDALQAADLITFSPATIELAAAALWDQAPPVRYGVRPNWAAVKDDPDWAHPVGSTRNDAKLVTKTLQDAASEAR
ncbi:hypothetical protein ACQCSX_22545 (plasmid) [Pseudarthrobacter sp. P1]|uniref:hypothetical protein n=1 Tax=Pseudarthrobacter sp. P1 TaxID=3418418 RepID=UPI003CEC9766